MIRSDGQPPVIVHMGYVRTSTTMHQRCVFTGHEKIHYIGKPFPDARVLAAFRNLACRDTATFDEQHAYRILRESAVPPPHTAVSCVLLSDEILLSQFSTDIEVVLRRLQSAFGEIKVLLTIREQFQTFRSWCEHVLDKSEYGCLQTIVDYHFKFRETKDSLISFLDYYRTYSFLCENLGPDRVLMIPYELMRFDPNLYVTLLAGFLEVPRESIQRRIDAAPRQNARPSASDISFFDFKKRHLFPQRHRRFDHLGLAIFRYIPYRRERTERLMREMQECFACEFSIKNVALRAALIKSIGIDIAKLGYSLPPKSNDSRP